MSTENLKELRNALSCWQDDYDCDDDKEQYDMFGAAIDAISRLEVAERANSAQSDHINQQQDRIDSLEQKNAALGNALGTAERERDELKQRLANAEHQLHMAELTKFNLRNQRKAQFRKRREAEAELARRDAAAGERAGFVEVWPGTRSCDFLLSRPLPVGQHNVYTAAPPAVLPPKYADELTERAELIEAYSKTQCEIAKELGCDSDNESILKAIYELKDLGAQQQKVVELHKRKSTEVISGQRYSYVLLEDLLPELDAAGVKWEVKK